MRRRKLAWMMAAKLALTFALTLPVNRPSMVQYRALSVLPGVRAGTPVTLAGLLIGHVVAKNRRGDTTFLSVRFNRGAKQFPGNWSVGLRWMGFGQGVALELQPFDLEAGEAIARGGWLHLIPLVHPPQPQPGVVQPRRLPAEEPAWLQLIPTTPAAPRPLPPASA
jgi:hypothetical protein